MRLENISFSLSNCINDVVKMLIIKEIRFIASCIIIGLEYIHKKGIIHRDIKPENLIFDEKGYLRISDFGIAIRNEIICEKDKNNDKSGTPGYMAPERIINNKNISYSYSSDFFSLGVILYELTMLKKPFRRNLDKIGNIQYISYEDIIFDLFNNDNINLTPSLVKNQRNLENVNKNEINVNNEELNNLCDLINKLLIYEQKYRLGYNNIEDIKNHPFFGNDFEWKKIYHRSYNSPFNTYNSYINKKNENKKSSILDLYKENKIIFASNEEKENFQTKFNNFTLIHKITKEDFNYFYLNGNSSQKSSKYNYENYTIKKFNNNIRKSIKNTFSILYKNNSKFLSQDKKRKKENQNINLKYKIMPLYLFKENTNNLIKEKSNPIVINTNSIKIEDSPKKLKIKKEIIEENFMNSFFNKTNLNIYKIKNLKYNNNENRDKNDNIPLINSDSDLRKSMQKTPSAILYKKLNNSNHNNKRKNRIFFAKNSFEENFLNLLINKKKTVIKNKKSNIYFNTNIANNNNEYNSLKLSRIINEKSTSLNIYGDTIINEKKYRDKIIKENNSNIDKIIKEILKY